MRAWRLAVCALAMTLVLDPATARPVWAAGSRLQQDEHRPQATVVQEAGIVPRNAGRLAQGSRSVTGPCTGVLHWLRQEGEEGWLRRCQAAAGERGMTYGGVTHSCQQWIAICRQNPGYHGGPIRAR
jgi:hypothetical protein